MAKNDKKNKDMCIYKMSQICMSKLNRSIQHAKIRNFSIWHFGQISKIAPPHRLKFNKNRVLSFLPNSGMKGIKIIIQIKNYVPKRSFYRVNNNFYAFNS